MNQAYPSSTYADPGNQNSGYQPGYQQPGYQQPAYQQPSNQPGYPQQPFSNTPPIQAFQQEAAASITGLQGSFQTLCTFPYVQIKQAVEQLEVLTGYETGNKYAVLDPQGSILMKCNEKSTIISKLALGAGRSMDIKITDINGSTLMNIMRPFKLWHKNVTITDGTGRLVGTVLKKFAVGKTIFHVMNGQDQQLFTIRGGAFINIGKSRKFTISNSQGTEVGYIQKEWAGIMKEAFTDADNFSIHFPAGSSGETRALLIATTLFIDLSHFEK